MAKVKRITQADVDATLEACFEVQQRLVDLATKLERGQREKLPKAIDAAWKCSALTAAAADVVNKLLIVAAMEEDNRELETTLRERMQGTTS